MRHVLAFDIPTPATGVGGAEGPRRSIRKRRGASAQLPGVEGVAVGSFVPWRDAGSFGPACPVHRRGLHAGGRRRESARADSARRRRGFFAVLGVPLLAGRDFTDDDRDGSEPVVIVSQSVAQRLFPNGDALNRQHVVDRSVLRQAPTPRRIVGIVADVDDENVVPAARR